MGLFLEANVAEKFMIKGVLKMPFKFLGQEVWITDSILSMCLISLILIIFAIFCSRYIKKAKLVPQGFQNAIEMIVELIDNMVKGTLGDNAIRFRNYIGTIFVFILFANLSGLIGLRAPTADYGVTLPLGVFTFIIIQFQGFKNNGINNFLDLFKPTPLLFPINIIGEITTPITLSLRLFANLLSGVIIMGLWYGMIPLVFRLGLPTFLHAYCDLFSGCIQAYVFSMLTMVYVSQKL